MNDPRIAWAARLAAAGHAPDPAAGAVHALLGGMGFIPVLGSGTNAIDALLYGLEGDWGGAALSGAGAIPLLGEGANVAKVARLAGRGAEIAEGAIRVERTATQELTTAFHYTSESGAAMITENGLRAGSYATPAGNLSPLQASLELALPPNRALPTHVVQIDMARLAATGYQLPSVTRVGNVVRSESRVYTMPGGGYEMWFQYPIPSEFLTASRIGG